MHRKFHQLTTLCKIVPLFGLLIGGAAGAATVTLAPTDDTYVYNFAPTTNYGSAASFATGNVQSGNSIHRWYSFLKFDLSGIPSGQTIVGATLHLYQVNGAGFTTGGTDVVHVADDSWSEGSVTWNNQPAMGSVLGSSPDTKDHRGWSQWDLFSTGMWNAAADQTDNVLSLALKESAAGTHNWCSKESDLTNCLAPGESGPAPSLRRPYLEVSYVPVPAAVWLFGSGLFAMVGFASTRKVSKRVGLCAIPTNQVCHTERR
ncbi:MAG: DNRLRE domain-containing protein [Gammaproteobacteria bacterium]